jgi:two-component sensor histidine kinase
VKKNIQYGFLHKPKVITPEDRIRLRKVLEFILTGTYFDGKTKDLDLMMKSTSRVVCLKFIESMISVHETVDHDHISKFFDIYIKDINSRMNLQCNLDKEFRFNDFKIRKFAAMKLCLAIGEWVTNSLNQAGNSHKELTLKLTMGYDPSQSKQFTIGYRDNGKGWVGDLDLRDGNRYGLAIAHEIGISFDADKLLANEPGKGNGTIFNIDKNKVNPLSELD